MRTYVLDEYKDLLFPKHMKKFEKAHALSIQREKDDEKNDSREVRKKILALAEMMQYDDDVEESKVSEHKNHYQSQERKTTPAPKAQAPKAKVET